MIVYDLACSDGGHVFEGWFGSSDDFDAQKARGLLSCPVCGSGDVAKAAMAPAVPAKSNQRGASPMPVAMDGKDPALIRRMLADLARVQAKVLEGSDYVGDRFADEARAIHLGESDQRAIHGEATPTQAKSLIEDGIAIAPLPLPVRPPGTDN